MTRATLFRVIVATLLLPNFTAYWYMLPRRMKRCRTAMQAILQMVVAHQSKEWERVFAKAIATREYWMGHTVVVDPCMDKGTIEFRYGDEVVGGIFNIGETDPT